MIKGICIMYAPKNIYKIILNQKFTASLSIYYKTMKNEDLKRKFQISVYKGEFLSNKCDCYELRQTVHLISGCFLFLAQ